MKPSIVISIVVIVLVLIGAWYWMSGAPKTDLLVAETQTEQQNGQILPIPEIPESATKAFLTVRTDAKLGKYLANGDGMTLYVYAKDAAGVSNCSGTCATNWPPLPVLQGSLPANSEITGRIGIVERADGTLQTTYNDKPLYLWVQDKKSGQVSGNEVNGFTVAKP